MGKYMRKSKGTGGVALIEVSHHSHQPSLGVRTRAKTLALQRLQTNNCSHPSSSSSSPPPAAVSGGGGNDSGGAYLELRSRRLEKLSPIGHDGKRQQKKGRKLGVEEKEEEKEKIGEEIKEEDRKSKGNNGDFGVEEASFGENVLEFEGRERTTRESTPCSLIRDPNAIRTPGSSTRPSIVSEPNYRESMAHRQIPTAAEMEDFFSGEEELQRRKFIEKYNFDPATDKPLPGRYEWERLDH